MQDNHGHKYIRRSGHLCTYCAISDAAVGR